MSRHLPAEVFPIEFGRLARWPTVDAFYGDDEQRRFSPEWDYGVHWRIDMKVPWPVWRVSWVVNTGDLYASRCNAPGMVLLLGNVPTVGDYPVGLGMQAWSQFRSDQVIERRLEGWASVDPPLLSWVLGRIS